MTARLLCAFCVSAAAAMAGSSANAASLAFHNTVAADNPLLWYQLNETSGNVLNHGSLGATHDAEVFGTPVRGAATFGGDAGIAFTGNNDFLQSLADAPASLTGNPSFSVEAIFFVPSSGGTASGWAPLLHWGKGTGDNQAIAGEEVFFGFSGTSADEGFAGFYNAGVQTVDPVGIGEWHHFVWTRQGGGDAITGTTVYIDGVPVTVEPDLALCCNQTTTPNIFDSTEFRVNRGRDYDGQRFLVGSLDEVVLYDRVLSAEEVRQHFNAFVPLSGAIWFFLSGLAAMGALARIRD